MDDFLKAIAIAVEQGSALAYPALIGYYLVRALETIVPDVTIVAVVVVVARAIHRGMQLGYSRMEQELREARRVHKELTNIDPK